MKIKNTRELVLRAQGHARADHIKQGTYGQGAVNGHAEYQGCAIGCLSTPHRKGDLRAWLRDNLWGPAASLTYVYQGSDAMTKQLADEFGISPQLARAAESLFEGFYTHGDAINFIPEFAKSLNEGADIQVPDLRKAWRAVGGRRISRSSADLRSSVKAEEAAPKFLAWLREQR